MLCTNSGQLVRRVTRYSSLQDVFERVGNAFQCRMDYDRFQAIVQASFDEFGYRCPILGCRDAAAAKLHHYPRRFSDRPGRAQCGAVIKNALGDLLAHAFTH